MTSGSTDFSLCPLKPSNTKSKQRGRLPLESSASGMVTRRRNNMFTGCGTAMVTPFRGDGSLDEPTLRNLIQRQIDAGIEFLVPCGTTGESPTLSHEEHLRVVEVTVELARGKVLVLAGAGGYNT